MRADEPPTETIPTQATFPGVEETRPRSFACARQSAGRAVARTRRPQDVPSLTVETHVAPPDVLARAAAEIGREVEHEVLHHGKRADRLLSSALRRRRDLLVPDGRFVSRAVFALFRWRGWIEPLGPKSIEARLMLACLLDFPSVPPACRVWARRLERDPGRLIALGDAPSWKARAEGFRRLLGGQPVTADPWRLFPPWFREVLPIPPGDAPTKTKFVALLNALQTPAPLWVRVQGKDPDALWSELREAGVKPWIHRRIPGAAKLDPDVDIYHLPAFERGDLEIQDLASQVVALVCDPDPGERWWDACAGAGGKALHLAALMGGKGVVVATDIHPGRLKETVRRARRSPLHQHHDEGLGRPQDRGQAEEFSRRSGRCPLLGNRHLETQPRRPLDVGSRGD